MASRKMRYDVVIESGGGSIRIPWGTGAAKGWVDRFRNELDHANKISLIPNEAGEGLPVVCIDLEGDRRWVIFSRVCGTVNQATGEEKRMRLYCIGWQRTVNGENVKSLTWIYPNGAIENSKEPTFVNRFLELL